MVADLWQRLWLDVQTPDVLQTLQMKTNIKVAGRVSRWRVSCNCLLEPEGGGSSLKETVGEGLDFRCLADSSHAVCEGGWRFGLQLSATVLRWS